MNLGKHIQLLYFSVSVHEQNILPLEFPKVFFCFQVLQNDPSLETQASWVWCLLGLLLTADLLKGIKLGRKKTGYNLQGDAKIARCFLVTITVE